MRKVEKNRNKKQITELQNAEVQSMETECTTELQEEKNQNKNSKRLIKKKVKAKKEKTEETGTIQENKKKSKERTAEVPIIYSIKLKLMGAFMLLVVLLVILGVTSYQKAASGIIQNYEDAMNSSMNMMLRYFETVSTSAEAKDIQLTCNEGIKTYFGGEYDVDIFLKKEKTQEISSLLHETAMTEKNISEIYVIASTQKPIGAINNLLPADIYDQFIASEEYGKLKDLGKQKTAWIGYHKGLDAAAKNNLDDYSISCVRTLVDPYGKSIGYIITDLTKEFVTETLETSELPKGSIAVFETSDGRQIITGTVKKDFSIADVLKKKSNSKSKYVNYDGKNYLLLEQKIEKVQGKIYTMIPKESIIQRAEIVKNVTMAIVLIGVIIGLILAAYLSRKIGVSIGKVNHVLKKSAEGDLTHKVKEKSKDEFHLLSSCVNAMMDNMKSMVEQMHHSSESVSESSKYMSEVSKELVGASDGIRLASHEIGDGVTQQANDIQECLERMNNLADMITEVNQTMTQVDSVVEHTNGVVFRGIEVVSELNRMDKETAHVTNQVIDNVQRLEEKSSVIAGFVDTINAIAESTNLLSLNASIESARAGEAGRGFGVVAGEIGKLASQSENASAEISKIIRGMQQETKETVESANKAKRAVESQEKALEETVIMFRQIKDKVTELESYMHKIVEQMSKMDVAKTETLGNIENISVAAQQTESASAEMESNSMNQMKVAEKMERAAEKLDEEYKQIAKIIFRFKI